MFNKFCKYLDKFCSFILEYFPTSLLFYCASYCEPLEPKVGGWILCFIMMALFFKYIWIPNMKKL